MSTQQQLEASAGAHARATTVTCALVVLEICATFLEEKGESEMAAAIRCCLPDFDTAAVRS